MFGATDITPTYNTYVISLQLKISQHTFCLVSQTIQIVFKISTEFKQVYTSIETKLELDS